jgi:hypothetical protein
MWIALLHLVPAVPLLTRGAIMVVFRELADEVLSEEAMERDSGRNVSLALAGFSFSAVVALVFLESHAGSSLILPLYFLFLSFIAFLTSSAGEGYKLIRWHDQAVAAAREAGSLSLIMGVIVLLRVSTLPASYRIFLSLVGIGAWLLEHLMYLRRNVRYLSEVKRAERRTEALPPAS